MQTPPESTARYSTESQKGVKSRGPIGPNGTGYAALHSGQWGTRWCAGWWYPGVWYWYTVGYWAWVPGHGTGTPWVLGPGPRAGSSVGPSPRGRQLKLPLFSFSVAPPQPPVGRLWRCRSEESVTFLAPMRSRPGPLSARPGPGPGLLATSSPTSHPDMRIRFAAGLSLAHKCRDFVIKLT